MKVACCFLVQMGLLVVTMTFNAKHAINIHTQLMGGTGLIRKSKLVNFLVYRSNCT